MSGKIRELISHLQETRDINSLLRTFAFFLDRHETGCLENLVCLLYSRSMNSLHLRFSLRTRPDETDFLSGMLPGSTRFFSRNREEAVISPFIRKGRQYLICPLMVRSRLIGYLVPVFSAKKPFSRRKKALYRELVYLVKNELYISNLFELVIRDDLTGLFNKRYLFDQLSRRFREFTASKKHDTCLGVLDIDRFKHYNDTYGHMCGDHILRTLSRLVLKYCSEHKIMGFRYGGEEIVLLFPACALDKAYELTDELRKRIEAYDFSNKDFFLKVRISGGISSVRQAKTIGHFIENSDKALYYSKQNGRNRITVFRSVSSS